MRVTKMCNRHVNRSLKHKAAGNVERVIYHGSFREGGCLSTVGMEKWDLTELQK